MARFTNVQRRGATGFNCQDKGRDTSWSYESLIIRTAWDKGCNFEDLADGFGAGLGTQGDWSAIRDSSDEAATKMIERALNFLFSEKCPICKCDFPHPELFHEGNVVRRKGGHADGTVEFINPLRESPESMRLSYFYVVRWPDRSRSEHLAAELEFVAHS